MNFKICTFFGHRDTPPEVKPLLREVLQDLIEHQGVKQFYVGNHGNFDAMVRNLLSEFERTHSIWYEVVLAYLPKNNDLRLDKIHTLLPKGIESVPPRFAIEFRNKWMIDNSDIVVTYVNFHFGGAAKFKALAARKSKIIIELSEYSK